jgi:hypothetical protein
MNFEATSNRKAFVKKIGVTLAAAFGAMAYPAIARAALQCCPSDQAHCGSCPPDLPQQYHCDCGAAGGYCACRQSNTGCFPAPC